MHGGPTASVHMVELTIVGRSVLVCSCASTCVAAQVSFARGLGTRTSSFLGPSEIGSCTSASAAKHKDQTSIGNGLLAIYEEDVGTGTPKHGEN